MDGQRLRFACAVFSDEIAVIRGVGVTEPRHHSLVAAAHSSTDTISCCIKMRDDIPVLVKDLELSFRLDPAAHSIEAVILLKSYAWQNVYWIEEPWRLCL